MRYDYPGISDYYVQRRRGGDVLSGEMMPVTQLIMTIRSTSPQNGAGLLMAMPAEQLPVVVAAMASADLARLLPAARPDLRDRLLHAAGTEQLVDLVRHGPLDQAVAVLTPLPDERLRAVAQRLPDQVVSALLTAMPRERHGALLGGPDPGQTTAALSPVYRREVADALARANTAVSVPAGAPEGILLARTLGWWIVVAPRYGDDGRVGVRDAEDAAYRLRASAALSVTDRPPADDVLRYCRQARQQGRPIEAVAWLDDRHDGQLKRALVSLFHRPSAPAADR
jgi:hypothetical protein